MTSWARRHACASACHACVRVPHVGYPSRMRRRISTRWMVVAFVLLGCLVALVLLIRDLGDDNDVPEDDGTVPALTR